MSTQPFCWTVNSKGEIWTLYQKGGGALMSPPGADFAFEIAIGPSVPDVWIISTVPRQGGAVPMVRPVAEDNWLPMAAPAAATKISVAPDGMLWTVNASGEVWALYPQGGGYLASPPGVDFAFDIGAGPDGSVWVVSTEARQGGNVLQSYNQSTQTWTPLAAPAAAIHVAVGPKGVLYTVNSVGEVWLIYPQGGGALLSPPGVDFGQEISVGPDGTVWLISTEPRAGGNVVMWWSGQNQIWNSIPAPAAAVKVAGTI
ncbi:MAG: hypothetical protein ACJ74W_03840 [Pyrinomonadaceae bacterium]